MKLVTLLALHMGEWPEGVDLLTQSREDREVYIAEGEDQACFPNNKYLPELHTQHERYPEVTQEDWEAERRRLGISGYPEAPEGATHWGPETMEYFANWYKVDVNGILFWSDGFMIWTYTPRTIDTLVPLDMLGNQDPVPDINWSEAPEGTTHWEQSNGGFSAGYMKYEPTTDHWFFHSSFSGRWILCEVRGSRMEYMIERPVVDTADSVTTDTVPTEWKTGELPPVGTKCLVRHHDIGDYPIKCEIIYHFDTGYCEVAAFLYHDEREDYTAVKQGLADCFSPIEERTEREIWIETAAETMHNSDGISLQEMAEALYDAGLASSAPGKSV